MLDDVGELAPATALGSSWTLFTDQVMGGLSAGSLVVATMDGRRALRLQGTVSLANDGGFVQMSLDLGRGGGAFDASAWRGIELDVQGNGEIYGAHLRTVDLVRPWQSYRRSFAAPACWTTIRLPFASFVAHRVATSLDVSRLRRIGLVAIGRAFTADLSLAGLRLYR